MNATACLPLLFLPCQSSVDSRMNDVCLLYGLPRIEPLLPCASIVFSKREFHRAIRHKSVAGIERWNASNSSELGHGKFYGSSNFSFDTSLPQKILRVDSHRRESSNRDMHAYAYGTYGIHTNTHSSLNQCWRRFTGYQDDSWKGDRGNLVSCDNRMWYLESVMQNSKRSFVLVFASVWRYSRLYRGNQVEIVVGSMEFFIHWHQSVIKLEILTCSVRIFNDGCWKRSTIEMQRTTNCNIFEIYYIQICIILFIHILHYQLTICINNM